MKIKKIGVIFSIFLLTSILQVMGYESTNNYPSIVVGPYPQSPDIDSIIIIWTTSSTTSINSVHFGGC